MKVLVVGSGAREHALVWKIRQSPLVDQVFCAPGNAGTSQISESVPIGPKNISSLVKFASQNRIDLTIPASDEILALVIVDLFQKKRLPIFGPTLNADIIERSKVKAKQIMAQYKIPTAKFQAYDNYHDAVGYVERHEKRPMVVKADGLCGGKGVFVCQDQEKAEEALRKIMLFREFDEAGDKVVMENCLSGRELSIHAICDGEDYVMLPPTKDYKEFCGRNTGGMGTVSASWITDSMMQKVARQIVEPLLKGLCELDAPFQGCLYPGLMITSHGPKVLEFNARFGDPECQVLMRQLKTDPMELFLAVISHTLKNIKLKTTDEFVANVVLVSRGYPGRYETGFEIAGIEEAEKMEGVKIFHANTAYKNSDLVTAGGRVLSVTSMGANPLKTICRAYEAADLISFYGKTYRNNIGYEILSKEQVLV